MPIIPGNSDSNNKSCEIKTNMNLPIKRILASIFTIFAILILCAFVVLNLPGRYQAVVISNDGIKELLIVDTIRGNTWRYQCTRSVSVITYQGKLKTGDMVPEKIVNDIFKDQ